LRSEKISGEGKNYFLAKKFEAKKCPRKNGPFLKFVV